MPDLVPVRVRDCACPDSPHVDGDVVFLYPTLSLAGGIAAQQDIVASGGEPQDLTRRWLVTFVRYGAASANFLEPFDVGVLLADFELSMAVAEAADALYGEAVLRPLGLSRPQSSPSGQTDGSTSRTRRSTRK